MSTPEPAMDYRRLLQSAACASGWRDQDLRFEYKANTLRVRKERDGASPPGAEAPPPAGEAQVIPSYTAAIRPDRVAVASVAADEVELAGEQARFPSDALFWSEAAVEKFLLPYYATATGYQADGFLADLLGAWYDSDRDADEAGGGTALRVRALSHVSRPVPGSDDKLDLYDTVGVLFTKGDSALQVTDLRTFLTDYRPVRRERNPVGSPALLVSDWKPEPRVSALALREVAEWASGLRGLKETEAVFMVDRRGKVRLLEPETALRSQQYTYINADTRSLKYDWKPLGSVRITPAQGKPVELAETADAAFWSEGAVEQFLLPYYASKSGRRAVGKLRNLLLAFNGCVDEGDGCHGGAAAAARTAALAEEDGETWPTFALIHLPRSDYQEATEGSAPPLENQKTAVCDLFQVLCARGKDGEPAVLTIPQALAELAGEG